MKTNHSDGKQLSGCLGLRLMGGSGLQGHEECVGAGHVMYLDCGGALTGVVSALITLHFFKRCT